MEGLRKDELVIMDFDYTLKIQGIGTEDLTVTETRKTRVTPKKVHHFKSLAEAIDYCLKLVGGN